MSNENDQVNPLPAIASAALLIAVIAIAIAGVAIARSGSGSSTSGGMTMSSMSGGSMEHMSPLPVDGIATASSSQGALSLSRQFKTELRSSASTLGRSGGRSSAVSA